MSIFDLILKGGVLMIPISLCSVFALGIIVERVIHYRKAKGNFNRLREKLEPLIIGNKVSEGRLLCEESGGVISNIFRVALQELQKEPDMTQPVEDEIEVTRRGLLGTVLGMIKVFFTIGIGQSVPDPSVLAKGIGLALITTAAGLIVAIPSFFMHRYFVGQVDYFLEEAQKAKGWLLAQLAKRRLISMSP